MNNIPLVQGLPGNPPAIPKLFDVPPIMEQFMTPLSGLLMHNLQTRALAGNGNHVTMFWVQCTQNGFNNPFFREALLHAASLAFMHLQQNPGLANNVPTWLNQEADTVAISYPVLWASNNAPQLFNSLDAATVTQVRASISDYYQVTQQATQLFQNGSNMNAAMMMGMGGFNNGMGMSGFNNTGWNNAGVSPQQMAMLMAQQQQQQQQNAGWGNNGFGQQNNSWFGQQGTGFNGAAFGNQVANNQMQNSYNGQGGNWTFNNGAVNNDNILTAGKVAGFVSADQGNGKVMTTQEQFNELWGAGNNNQQQSQQTQQNNDPSYGWGASATTSGFTAVNTSGQNSMDSMMSAHANEINAAASIAPLQNFGQQEVVTPTPAPKQTQVVTETQSNILVNPSNLVVKIPMVNGSVQRHLKFYDPTTQYSVCEVKNGKIVKQDIRTKEAETMDFEDQNTAPFLKPKGMDASTAGLDQSNGLTLAQTAERALHYSYLDGALKQINDESTAETITSEEIAKGLARISEDKIIRLDNMIDAPFNTPSTHFQQYFNHRGVDAIFNKSVIVGDIIQLDNSILTDELADRIDGIRTGENTVSNLVYGFNRLRAHLGENNWARLNREITVWLNEELYAKYGLSLAIDDFAAQFEELSEIMQQEKNGFSWEEIQELIANITVKFLNVYRHNHPSAVNIYTEENGYNSENQYNLLGIVQRYVFLPLYSKDLSITTNSTSGIVTASNQPELYGIISTTLSNLNAGNDVIARNFLVTLNGDQILVTRPHGMSQFILTRMENGMIKNPLL